MQIAAFIVPAILFALKQSRYARVAKLIPGEADPYCARKAHQQGGLILTTDSDLLLYDLGHQGFVAYLDSVEFPQCSDEGRRSTKARIFRPSEIAAKLQLPDLLRLAFELKSHSKAGCRAKTGSSDFPSEQAAEEFSEFCSSYTDCPFRENLMGLHPDAWSKFNY